MTRDKVQRQVDAQLGKMEQQLARVHSLSVALVQAQVFFQDFERERDDLPTLRDDDELLREHLVQLSKVDVDAFARVKTYLDYFLAALYAACEKWREWQFDDLKVEALMASPHFQLLKKHRHSIFHADHLDEASALALARDTALAQWSIDLVSAMKTVLLDWHINTDQRMREHLYRTY